MFTVKVTYKDNLYSFPNNTTLLEISKQFSSDFKYDIIIASVDNKLKELNSEVEKDCEVEFYDMSHLLGNRVYERGLVYLYIKAVKDILDCDVFIEHSIDRGIYTEVISPIALTDNDVEMIDSRMRHLVKESMPFEKISVSRIEAIDYFKNIHQDDKADSLKYISNTFINLYKLDKTFDYLYGEMPINTSYLTRFKLSKVKAKGIVLRFPNIYLNCDIAPYVHHEKLFEEFKKNHNWCSRIKLDSISDLNKVISTGDVRDLIYMCEIEQNGRLMDIARKINTNPEVRVILMAGPSSSGKTTTSKKLSFYLRSMGLTPCYISIDDYFFDRDRTPKNADGEPDFESIGALDIDLFNKNLKGLLNGEEVELPEFDFITGKPEFNGRCLQLGPKDIIIVEGLHALNNDLTASIEKRHKYKIYISPLTSINLDNHNRISTSDNRLLRRMIRDHRYRGYNAKDTLANWQNVREGEEKYIFPYQDTADIIFNTLLVYELGVLRLCAEPLLFSVDDSDPYYGEAMRLINILRNVLPITTDSIPSDSIIREFIGDSYFIE